MGRVEKHAFHALTPTCAPGRGVRSQRARHNAVETTVSNDRGATGGGGMPSSPRPLHRGCGADHRHGLAIHGGGAHSMTRTPTQARAGRPGAGANSFRLFDFFSKNHRRSILPTRRTIRRRVIYFRSYKFRHRGTATSDACIAILVVPVFRQPEPFSGTVPPG